MNHRRVIAVMALVVPLAGCATGSTTTSAVEPPSRWYAYSEGREHLVLGEIVEREPSVVTDQWLDH